MDAAVAEYQNMVNALEENLHPASSAMKLGIDNGNDDGEAESPENGVTDVTVNGGVVVPDTPGNIVQALRDLRASQVYIYSFDF